MTDHAAVAALRAVIYTRVSSDRDGAGRSVGEQEASCRADCERNGWPVVTVLTDNDRGASRWSRKARPAYRDLADLLATGRVDVLMTWESSRAQRDVEQYVALRNLCAEHGVLWSYNGRLYNLDDDDDRFATGIDALMSEREAGLTRKRVLRSVEARASTGRPHGRLLDGYAIEYDPATGKPTRRIVDPVRGPIVREIADRLLAGESAYGIAADLNDRGITTRTGKSWLGGNIVKRIQSPTLAGLRVHRGQVLRDVEATWPPILTAEEHHRLIALLSDPKRKLNKEGRTVKHLGTGIYLCGVCESAVRIITGYRPNGTRRVRYVCSETSCVMRSAEHVDALVEETIVNRLSRPDALESIRDASEDETVRAGAAEVARLTAELTQAREMHRAGRLSLDSVAHLESWALPALEAAERQARPRSVPDAVFDIAGPDAAVKWEALSVTVRRSIVKALVTVKIHTTTAPSNQHTTFDTAAIEIISK